MSTRTKTLQVRVTEEEKELIEKLAKNRQYTVSELLHQYVLKLIEAQDDS